MQTHIPDAPKTNSPPTSFFQRRTQLGRAPEALPDAEITDAIEDEWTMLDISEVFEARAEVAWAVERNQWTLLSKEEMDEAILSDAARIEHIAQEQARWILVHPEPVPPTLSRGLFAFFARVRSLFQSEPEEIPTNVRMNTTERLPQERVNNQSPKEKWDALGIKLRRKCTVDVTFYEFDSEIVRDVLRNPKKGEPFLKRYKETVLFQHQDEIGTTPEIEAIVHQMRRYLCDEMESRRRQAVIPQAQPVVVPPPAIVEEPIVEEPILITHNDAGAGGSAVPAPDPNYDPDISNDERFRLTGSVHLLDPQTGRPIIPGINDLLKPLRR